MKLLLRILTVNDVTQSYVDWFKISDVTRFSDNQYYTFSLETQKEYVLSCTQNKNVDLYGIFEEKKHIGNILIKNLNSPHKCAEITYVIGNIDYWNKGVAFFAVSKIIDISRTKYRLNKLLAGVAEQNIRSVKVLEKNGFKLVGKRLEHLFYGGKFHNQLDYELKL
jgi:ribosomal-protein-alanine N-acetyltransferase